VLLIAVAPNATTTNVERIQSRVVDVGHILRRVIEGDDQAWDELVGQFGGLVWSVARGYRLGALTDDVVQTVWLRLAENCERIREPDRLAGWLATTTRNEALRVAKKQQRALSLGEMPEQVDLSLATLDELVADSDTLVHVLGAFSKLADKDKELLRLLCTVPPLDYASIADILGRSIGSIGPSRDRALKKLRKLLPTGLIDEAAIANPAEQATPPPDAPDDAQPPVEETER
jgi:RNA polymerase sigma factor (sigma-70 family)